MKASRWFLVIVILVVLVGCGSGEGPAVSSPAPGGGDGTPRPTTAPLPAGKAIAADGRLASPYPSVALGFGGGASGRVLTVTVRAGDAVQAGDLLALLDDVDLQRAVEEAQLTRDRAVADRDRARRQWERDVADAEKTLADAERALAIARLQDSETALEEARISLKWAQKAEVDRKAEYEKAQTFWPPIPVDGYRDAWYRAIDERELAEMRLADAESARQVAYLERQALEEDVAQARWRLEALQEGMAYTYDRAVEDAEIKLAQAQETLGHARLTAPWPAIVLSIDVAPGATVGAGAPVVTLLNVEDGLRFISSNLSEQHIADVYPGQRAMVTLRAFAETSLEGVVEAVIPQVGEGEATDARFTVHVRLAPTDLRLLPGLTGRAEIFTGKE